MLFILRYSMLYFLLTVNKHFPTIEELLQIKCERFGKQMNKKNSLKRKLKLYKDVKQFRTVQI